MKGIALPDIQVGAILADPPLRFATWSRKGEGRSPQRHYACLSFAELAAILVAKVATADCFLFLWVTLRSVPLTEPLMQAWGFGFSGVGFSWVKQNRSGVGWFMGGGAQAGSAAGILRRRRPAALERDRAVLPAARRPPAQRVGAGIHQRHGREQPSEKQAKHLLATFVKLGGKYHDHKAAHLRR